MSDDLRPATTVLLLRERGALEVFLVKRHARSRFMPSAWVFPGGRVDPDDHALPDEWVRGGQATADRLGLCDKTGRGFLVAGVRETFEEAGIWLGKGELPTALREPLNRNEVRFVDLLASHSAVVDLDRLHPWSWWVTPTSEPRRYDTRFVVAVTDADGLHDDGETVDSGWFTPAAALRAVADGDVRMAPPTWWTVQELAAMGSIAAVLESSKSRTIARIQPILEMGEGTVRLTLPGHTEHPEPAIPGLPDEISLKSGRWWASSPAE